MELKEFIKTVLTDITDAVRELQDELTNGAIVSPTMPNAISNVTIKDPQNEKSNRQISKIDFDVAITVDNADKIESGIKANIHIFSAKIGGKTEGKTENVSRITFSIPVVLPTYYVKTYREIAEAGVPHRKIDKQN